VAKPSASASRADGLKSLFKTLQINISGLPLSNHCIRKFVKWWLLIGDIIEPHHTLARRRYYLTGNIKVCYLAQFQIRLWALDIDPNSIIVQEKSSMIISISPVFGNDRKQVGTESQKQSKCVFKG
jgi:hypothetical protein